MSKELTKSLDAAHAVGTPLVAITTADPGATVEALVRDMEALPGEPACYVAWDCVGGGRPLTEQSKDLIRNVDFSRSVALPSMLLAVKQLPENSVVFIYNAHRFLDNPIVVQAIWNLRDVFKSDRRMLVLLGPSLQLPRELVQDVVSLDEPLPTETEIGAVLDDVTESIKEAAPTFAVSAADRERAVEALTGMTAFAVENTAYRSKTLKAYDVEALWARKKKQVEQTKGLSFATEKITFDDIGGIERIKEVTRAEFAGPAAPKLILFVDEVDKALAGTSGEGRHGDSSGTSDDAANVLLQTIEGYKWLSRLLVGPPGCTKTMYGLAVGPTFGRQVLKLDLGACKGSHVGESETYIRDAMRTVHAIANGAVEIIATCNRMDSLTPEMLRRLRSLGVWYFGLPVDAEKDVIWDVQLKAFGLASKHLSKSDRPDDARWSGSDIRDCCRGAYIYQCSLKEAADNVVPTAVVDPSMIERLENMADGHYLSASYKGVYKRPTEAVRKGRSIAVSK